MVVSYRIDFHYIHRCRDAVPGDDPPYFRCRVVRYRETAGGALHFCPTIHGISFYPSVHHYLHGEGSRGALVMDESGCASSWSRYRGHRYTLPKEDLVAVGDVLLGSSCFLFCGLDLFCSSVSEKLVHAG